MKTLPFAGQRWTLDALLFLQNHSPRSRSSNRSGRQWNIQGMRLPSQQNGNPIEPLEHHSADRCLYLNNKNAMPSQDKQPDQREQVIQSAASRVESSRPCDEVVSQSGSPSDLNDASAPPIRSIKSSSSRVKRPSQSSL